MNEDLDEVLGRIETPVLPRHALLDETLHVLYRQRVWRRTRKLFSLMVGAVAVFFIGYAVGVQNQTPPQVITLETVTPAPSPPPVEKPSRPSLDLLEQTAELSNDPATVAKLYREAGDRYLTERSDYAQAARCYRLSLEAGGETRVAANDTWLMISMKTSTRKE